MPILNYSTRIEAAKTAAEILGILARIKAREATITYGPDQQPIALTFVIAVDGGEPMRFRLPARVEGVHRALIEEWKHGRVSAGQATEVHARRVAWRILKDWVEAQVATIQAGLIRPEEVMLPYALTEGGLTFFESFQESRKALPPGRGK